MSKSWSKYAGAIFALILVSGVALLIGMVGANFTQTLTAYLLHQAEWTAKNTVQASNTLRTIMNVYYILYGVIFLGVFIFLENWIISQGVPKNLVLRRTVRSLGIEALILAAFQLGMMTYLRITPLQIGLAAVEIIAGVGLTFLGRRMLAPVTK